MPFMNVSPVVGGGAAGLWSQSGVNIYFNTGNVGVNIPNPTESLTMSGALSFSAGSFAPGSEAGFGKMYVLEGQGGNDGFTKLLLHMDGVDGAQVFVDSSADNKAVYVTGDVFTSDTEKQFGLTSAKFDGTGDHLHVDDDDDWSFTNGDFTIDCWVYIETFAHPNNIWAQGSDNNDNYRFGFTDANGFYVYSRKDSVTRINFVLDHDVAVQTWTHIALVRHGNNFYFFVDGVLKDTDVDADHVASLSGSAHIGAANNGAWIYLFEGYIDELRITKGEARWITNFTPPAAAYDKSGLFYKNENGDISAIA